MEDDNNVKQGFSNSLDKVLESMGSIEQEGESEEIAKDEAPEIVQGTAGPVDQPATNDKGDGTLKNDFDAFSSIVKGMQKTASDLSDTMTLLVGDLNSVRRSVDKRYEKYTDEEVAELTQDPDSYLHKFLNYQHTQTQRSELYNLMFQKALASNDNYKQTTEGPLVATSHTEFKTGSGTLKGDAAKLAILSKTTGVKKNMLLNSGFYVQQKPLVLEDLHNAYTAIDEELKEYGRMYSAHSLLMGSVVVESVIMKALHNSIADSNLVGYENYNTFLSNIHNCDYDTLLWGAVSLMFPKGVNITQLCVGSNCTHEEKFLLDISKLRLDNLDLLDASDVVDIMSAERTPEQLKVYRDRIFKEKVYDLQEGLQVTFSPPTMSDRIVYGLEIVKHIVSKLKSNTRYKVEELVRVNTSKMVRPWIKNVRTVDEDGAVVNTIEDYEAIGDTLGVTLVESQNMYDKLVEYSATGRVTFIGHRPKPCPICKEFSMDKSYLQIGDVQTLFFIGVRQILILMQLQTL